MPFPGNTEALEVLFRGLPELVHLFGTNRKRVTRFVFKAAQDVKPVGPAVVDVTEHRIADPLQTQ